MLPAPLGRRSTPSSSSSSSYQSFSRQPPSRLRPTSSTSATATPTLSLTTSITTSTSLSRSGAQTFTFTTAFPTVFNVTLSPTSTTSQNATGTSTATQSATTSPAPITLDTKIDPAFGVLGALLIITGIPSAFLGHKNRWTSFFLIGFYTLSLTCWVLIVRFGVLHAVKPPKETVRGMFVLASVVAGVVGGGISIFFWKGSRYFIGAWGGLAFALYIQCFRDGGLIDPIGLRWIMYIGCSVVGFTLCTIPKLHYYIVLISTGFVGATAFMLGVDCFTTSNLKEFYMWNLGFKALFPKFTSRNIRFPVTQAMEIELGLLGAVALMGIAVQLQVLKILDRKLQEIREHQRRRDEEEEGRAATRFAVLDREREQWEKDHPTLGKHGRNNSALSGMPLMKDQEYPHSPGTPTTNAADSNWDLPGGKRRPSGLSDYYRDSSRSQSVGAIPALDLGGDIEDTVPTDFLSSERILSPTAAASSGASSDDDLRQKEALLAQIQDIRKSIEVLKDSPDASLAPRSRQQSTASRRTLSTDILPSTLDPRVRTQSMEMSDLVRQYQAGHTISRPTSAPLESWDSYVQDRKLLQPPSGVSPPIATTSSSRIPVPPAVAEALKQRRQRESSYELGLIRQSSASPSMTTPDRLSSPFRGSAYDLSDVPPRGGHDRSASSPVTILPPRKIAAPQPQRPEQPRTRTYEELAERHKEKMRDMQAPLLQAEKERAELAAAKARWERAKAVEKDAVTKRQAEKEKAVARKSQELLERPRRKSETMDNRERHARSLSADKLGALNTASVNSKRASTMKVEDWQRYQQDAVPAGRSDGEPRSQSTTPPFPDNKSRRMPRDPPM